jgi:hypothetical protein
VSQCHDFEVIGMLTVHKKKWEMAQRNTPKSSADANAAHDFTDCRVH